MRRKLLFGSAVLLTLGSVACSNPPEAQEVADLTASRSADMVRGMGNGMRMMSEMSSMQSLGDSATLLQGAFSEVPLTGAPSCPPEGCDGPTAGPTTPGVPDPTVTDAQAALLEKYLRERVFTEATVEATDGDSTLFRLMGEDLCTTGSAPADPVCVAEVDRMELRVRATRSGEKGLNLELLIGPERAGPVTLRFEPKSVAVVMDLSGAKAALVFLNPEAAQSLPKVMAGQLELRLTENGPQDLTFSTAILGDIRVELDASGATHAFTTAKTNPLSSLRMEGPAKRATFELNLGATEYRGPYQSAAAELAGKEMVLSLSGLSFAFSAEEGKEDFVVAHVGLGEAQSYVSLDGTKLFTADLNALSGRHFDLNLSRGADGLPLVRVLPEFDLVTRFFLQPLKVDATASVPPFYEDETYRVRLSGGGTPSLRPVPGDETTGFPGGLRVVSGELSLEAGGTAVTVPAGSCLVGKDVAAEGAHPLLGHFEASACP